MHMNEDKFIGNNDEHNNKVKVTNLYTILPLRQSLVTPYNSKFRTKTYEFNCFFSANLC